MPGRNYKVGDIVVYRKQKSSPRPGPRATEIHPSQSGENYTYGVDKYWIVVEQGDNGTLQVLTNRGKLHEVSSSDANLRHPRWWERFVLRSRTVQLRERMTKWQNGDREPESVSGGEGE